MTDKELKAEVIEIAVQAGFDAEVAANPYPALTWAEEQILAYVDALRNDERAANVAQHGTREGGSYGRSAGRPGTFGGTAVAGARSVRGVGVSRFPTTSPPSSPGGSTPVRPPPARQRRTIERPRGHADTVRLNSGLGVIAVMVDAPSGTATHPPPPNRRVAV